jgi:hypothetical protein
MKTKGVVRVLMLHLRQNAFHLFNLIHRPPLSGIDPTGSRRESYVCTEPLKLPPPNKYLGVVLKYSRLLLMSHLVSIRMKNMCFYRHFSGPM